MQLVVRILVLLVVVGGIAHAEPPTFAIDLRAKEALADRIAVPLEEAFRKFGSAKTAEYRSKGTRKDRVKASTDECPNARSGECAQVIGGKLGVDFMFAGLVEQKNRKWVLELDMFSVRTGKRVRSIRDYAPTNIDPKKWALAVFTRIIDTSTGTLKISSNATRAIVFVDGQQATELFQGRGEVSGLAMGTHAIEIRATGFKTYVGDVTIDGTTPVNVLLDR